MRNVTTNHDSTIRRHARQQELIASKWRSDGLWRFIDLYTNFLISNEYGMDDDEALNFLQEEV